MNEISNEIVRIFYSGKQAGNMDDRFDAVDVVLRRRAKLERQVDAARYVRMRARGGDTFIDLKGRKLNSGWTEIVCDGLIADVSGTALVLMPADCIPLAIYSVKSPVCALVHVGRRGAEQGVHKKVLDYLLKTYYESHEEVRLYIGPAVGENSYYFPEIEVAQKMNKEWKPFISFKNRSYHIDLEGYVIKGIRKLGITTEQIKKSEIDTGEDPEYFSHVRSERTGEKEGRNTFVLMRQDGADQMPGPVVASFDFSGVEQEKINRITEEFPRELGDRIMTSEYGQQ